MTQTATLSVHYYDNIKCSRDHCGFWTNSTPELYGHWCQLFKTRLETNAEGTSNRCKDCMQMFSEKNLGMSKPLWDWK